MSRSCEARVQGEVRVLLECGMCDKREWVAYEMSSCGNCPEYGAVEASDTWSHQDDSIVCSEKCADDFWGGY